MNIANYVEVREGTLTFKDLQETSLGKALDCSEQEMAETFVFHHLMEEMSKMNAFCLAFGLDYEKLTPEIDYDRYNRVYRVINRYFASATVQREVTRFQSKIHSEFATMHVRALREQYSLGMSARSEKVRADALHQFIQNTRNPYLPTASNEDMQQARGNRQLLDTIASAFMRVTGQHGDCVVDAEVLTPQVAVGKEEKANDRIFPISENPSPVKKKES